MKNINVWEVIFCDNYTFGIQNITMSKQVEILSSNDGDSENETSYGKNSFKESSPKTVTDFDNTELLLQEDQKEKVPLVTSNKFENSASNVFSYTHSTPSRKRSFSSYENDMVYNKDSYKNVDVSERTLIRAKRSLPAQEKLSVGSPSQAFDSYFRRKSFPIPDIRSPQFSPNFSYSKCATDQTPYSPVSSYNRRQKRLRTALPHYNPSDLITFKSSHGFIDSHCHLDFLFQRQGFQSSYSDYQKNHKNTYPESYEGCLAIFCNPESFSKKHLWENYLEEENVWASFGCHPHNAKDYDDGVEQSLRTALEHPKVRALGEIGLDYSSRNNCMKELQHNAFKRQLKIALELKLPLVIHCREAHDDGMAIMKELVPKDYLIHLHCFTDKWEIANKWLHEFPNLFIGITNVVTFPSAESVHEVAKEIPVQRLLLETDAPYFIPRPLQREFPETRHSHPGMAIHVAAQIAAIKNMALEVLLETTRKNTKKMYNI